MWSSFANRIGKNIAGFKLNTNVLCRAPDTAKIKAKMMYASTKDFFKGYLDGLSIELQGSDLDDVSEQEANAAVRSSVTRQ